MSYRIITTLESELTFDQNMEYLLKEWSDKVIKKFLDRVESIVQKIKKDPFLFPLYGNEKNVHKAIINKHIILYYWIIDDNTIELLTFWNTYRNPKDLKF